MKRTLQCFFPVALALLFAATLAANNIKVSNISLTGENTTGKYVMVQFDLDWENSWRISSGPSNWDAAWVFVKYRITAANGGDDLWRHAWLNHDGHSSGTGTPAAIDAGLLTPGSPFNATTNPGLGVFIYRSANGSGTFSVTNAKLRWNYGANNIAADAVVDVRVFAIEMVYVPQGAFYVGSGGTESGRLYKADNTSQPFEIASEGVITTASSGAGNLWGASGTSGFGAVAPSDPSDIPAAFPKGFAAFYSMKYEITQQQYVDFLNTLTYDQQNVRIQCSPNASAGTFAYYNDPRHKIRIHTSGVASTTPATYATEHPYVACNYLSWMDGAAYSDWAGLRPMTELEFEKACRGTATPIANEKAWGTIEITQVTGINNSGAANETAANSGNGLSVHGNHGSVKGPLRVGALATSTTTTRQASGASYYGIMELSGNLCERTVTVGNTIGRGFTGVHGDGTLSTAGHANETDWPGLTSGEVTSPNGSGTRGGDWMDNYAGMRVSARDFAALPTLRRPRDGFRAVRSVP